MLTYTKYDYLVFDTLNTAYLVFNHPDKIRENKSELLSIQDKKIYKYFFRNFIEEVEFLKSKFLADNGEVVFLFDNYESRDELKELLKPLSASQNRRKVNPTYKSNRINQKYEFYNTVDVLRYYYLIQTSQYHTARITNLEADDLVPPCLNHISPNGSKNVLMITNDSDWCRYLTETTHYLPNLHDSPLDRSEFYTLNGYFPTEGKIVLSKIINGDTADNIDMVFPEFQPSLRNKIIDFFSDTQDFIINANKLVDLKEFVILIKERENDIRLAYQMLAAIPVSQQHFDAVYTIGRHSTTMLETLDKKLYPERIEKTGFSFGITIPRLDP